MKMVDYLTILEKVALVILLSKKNKYMNDVENSY